jgi:hypothetical protein
MVNDSLISKLKDFIRKHYELAEKPSKRPSGETLRKFAQGIMPRRQETASSFEGLADAMNGFIKQERTSETFSTMLERLRIEKGMTAAQLYKGAWIKKQLFSKIMGERNYHPSKNTAIAFGLSLRLVQKGMDGLLESAGYRLSNNSIADLVILFCLSQGIYDLHDVNALLLSADQNVLSRE